MMKAAQNKPQRPNLEYSIVKGQLTRGCGVENTTNGSIMSRDPFEVGIDHVIKKL
jgi:hypothetical protein